LQALATEVSKFQHGFCSIGPLANLGLQAATEQCNGQACPKQGQW